MLGIKVFVKSFEVGKITYEVILYLLFLVILSFKFLKGGRWFV